MNPESDPTEREDEVEAGTGSRLILTVSPFLLLALLFLLDRIVRG